MKDEFEGFARAAWPRLVRAASFMGLPEASAEDAAQSALVRCYARWHRLGRMARDPYAYCYRALINEVRRVAKKNPAHVISDRSAAPGLGEWPRTEESMVLMEAVDELPVHHRLVVTCRYLLDLSEQETANVLDIPTGTVKSRLARALASLATTPGLQDASTREGQTR